MLHFPIYLDYNATTPCDPQVVEAMLPYFTTQFGNAASRQHALGWQAEEAVDYARKQVAALIGADVTEIVFTSGATESNNLALKGLAEMYAAKGNHIITCVTEHKAVLDACKHLEKQGVLVTYLPVDREGFISLEQLEAAITPQTILIAIMYANNETGVIQPVEEIGRIAKQHGVIFFSDATQAVGKIPVNVLADGIDLMSFSAHKLYGPKGVGALYIRRKNPRVRITAQIDGGGHERGARSGTLNVPGIVGLGKAAELCRLHLQAEGGRLSQLRDQLEQGLLLLEGVQVNGGADNRLPHVSNLAFPNVDGNALMLGFNKNIAVATGSACTSASMEPSFVLKALGLPDDLARSSLRFSLGRFTTVAEIEYTIQRVSETVRSLRALDPFSAS
ncbi:IscS subfamily cysteine desulfurase [Paraflavitalea sp. CAU 1676]|uniref:IscS subfamily cysteine desulfurase n=1 Tax=Paraflavitalea sp. CAU 1676 TaxID=3032598 RepID=UPI0023DBBE83|nr:IscS subfamily cysteine desulfurase [Paraflavitalea sp. CAU 1676]MDF2187280.1 IscS subfamily cysteine desulfurase [Paraflavitalea sp. CAU 1676]